MRWELCILRSAGSPRGMNAGGAGGDRGTSGTYACANIHRSLCVRLSEMFPDKLAVGMELRDKVTEYVKERIGGCLLCASNAAALPQCPVAHRHCIALSCRPLSDTSLMPSHIATQTTCARATATTM